ncbi:MAG: prephenate dehydratase [Francisellaceae bacterium]
MKIIGVQGSHGSFSEIAGNQFAIKKNMLSYKIDYCLSSEGVLSTLSQKNIDYGVFAIENNTSGIVLESIQALSRYNCRIEEVFSIPISQNLMVRKGVKLSAITEVHSHIQALRQCQSYLYHHLACVDQIQQKDTAFAASALSHGILPETAAVIANKACADIYDLELIATDIQDNKNNRTTFLAVVPI